tara:strand:+ start:113216 stop:114004 length:789 start_codon:yes stop_codon:yes gene_type:complete
MHGRHFFARLFLLTSLLSSLTMANAAQQNVSGIYVDFGAGQAFYANPAAGNVDVVPDFETDAFGAGKVNHGVFNYQLGTGYQMATKRFWFPLIQAGLLYSQQLSATVKGHDYLEFQSSDFNNYSYQYSISTWQLFANVKADIVDWHGLSPYVEAGIGVDQNTANGYASTPKAPVVQPGLAYGNNTTTNFAWRLGLGLDYHVNKVFTVYAGYQYSGLGNAYLDSAATDSGQTGRGPGQANLATNTWLFGFSYLLGHEHFNHGQ